MVKVLVESPNLKLKGGVANYVDILSKKLREDGHSVLNFMHGLNPKYHTRFTYLLPIINSFQSFKYIGKLNSFNPDLVHLNPSLTWASIIRGFVFLRIAKLMNYPVLFFIRGWEWSLFNKIKKNDFLKKIFVNNLKKSDKILLLSKEFEKALIKLGINENKIGLTSTMVVFENYQTKNKKFNSNNMKILFCSRMAEDKGPYELMNSIPYVLEKEKEVNFVFMGDGPELENLKKKAVEMGIEECVRFTGYKTGKEKYEVFKNSNLFVFPTYHGEGFPNVVLEAMASGLPIICTKNAGLRRLIDEGKNGFFLNSMPANPNEIADKINRLIANPNIMESMRKDNLKKIKSNYTVDVVTERIKSIYHDMIT